MSVEREEVILSKVPGKRESRMVAPLFSILGCNVAVTELMVGGGLVAGLTVKNTIIASIIGNLILALIVYVQGKIGTREGLNTHVLTEMAFGKEGNKWVVSLLFAITLFGWFGIQDGLATLALQQIFPNINFVITAIILGILMTYFCSKRVSLSILV